MAWMLAACPPLTLGALEALRSFTVRRFADIFLPFFPALLLAMGSPSCRFFAAWVAAFYLNSRRAAMVHYANLSARRSSHTSISASRITPRDFDAFIRAIRTMGLASRIGTRGALSGSQRADHPQRLLRERFRTD